MTTTDSNGTGTAIDDAMRDLKQFKEEQAVLFKQQEEAFQQRNKEADQQRKELSDMMVSMQKFMATCGAIGCSTSTIPAPFTPAKPLGKPTFKIESKTALTGSKLSVHTH